MREGERERESSPERGRVQNLPEISPDLTRLRDRCSRGKENEEERRRKKGSDGGEDHDGSRDGAVVMARCLIVVLMVVVVLVKIEKLDGGVWVVRWLMMVVTELLLRQWTELLVVAGATLTAPEVR